jgi:hypothetical protein
MPQAAENLVLACIAESVTIDVRRPLWRRAEARAVWMIELMAQLEERQHAAAGQP